jgi:hypothetical protein
MILDLMTLDAFHIGTTNVCFETNSNMTLITSLSTRLASATLHYVLVGLVRNAAPRERERGHRRESESFWKEESAHHVINSNGAF